MIYSGRPGYQEMGTHGIQGDPCDRPGESKRRTFKKLNSSAPSAVMVAPWLAAYYVYKSEMLSNANESR